MSTIEIFTETFPTFPCKSYRTLFFERFDRFNIRQFGNTVFLTLAN